MTALSQSLGFYVGLVVCVCDVTGICDAKMVIMLRPVLPYIEEVNFIMAGLETSGLQETNTLTQSTHRYWSTKFLLLTEMAVYC